MTANRIGRAVACATTSIETTLKSPDSHRLILGRVCVCVSVTILCGTRFHRNSYDMESICHREPWLSGNTLAW